MNELDQYQDFVANDLSELIRKTDKHVKRGYKILSTILTRAKPTLWHRTMYLSSSVDLSLFKDFENVPIGDERQKQVQELGYIPLEKYSKHITWMVPKTNTPKLSVIREAIVNAFSVTENWDDKDTNLKNNILSYLEEALDEIEGEQIDDPSDTEF